MRTTAKGYVKFLCDGCGKIVERYSNAKVHYGDDYKRCGRLLRITKQCACPNCGHKHQCVVRGGE